MAEWRNRTGTAYALTVWRAIVPGHEDDVRGAIEGLPRGEDSPFARLGTIHTSRLQIFKDLVYQGAPQKRDELKSTYLIFTAAFDGHDLDPFLDSILDHLPDEAESWWKHCVGWPGTDDRAAFRKWIRDGKIDTSLFAVAYPGRTVKEVEESLRIRERVLDFAIENQGVEASVLQERFRAAFGDLT